MRARPTEEQIQNVKTALQILEGGWARCCELATVIPGLTGGVATNCCTSLVARGEAETRIKNQQRFYRIPSPQENPSGEQEPENGAASPDDGEIA